MKRVEALIIDQYLQNTRESVADTAKAWGVSPPTVKRYLRKHGIPIRSWGEVGQNRREAREVAAC